METMRSVASPLREAHLAPLPPECEVVQFGSALAEDEYAALADLLRTRPDVRLRVYFDPPADLGFLKHFPLLRRFTNDAYEATDLSALCHVPALTHLSVDGKRSRYDIAPIADLPNLRSVQLEKCKNTKVLSDARALTEVTLIGCNLGKNPGVWPAAERVILVQCKGELPSLPCVRHLQINAAKVADLSAVSEFTTLQSLELNSVRELSALPDLSNLPELRRVVVYRNRQLRDVSALRDVVSLIELELVDVDLVAAGLDYLAQLPRLARCRLALDSAEETARACAEIPSATADEHNPYRPFVRSEVDGAYHLYLFDPSEGDDLFRLHGRAANGHSWGRIAQAVLQECGLSGSVELDCEADLFAAHSADERVIHQLGERLISLLSDEDALSDVLRTLS